MSIMWVRVISPCHQSLLGGDRRGASGCHTHSRLQCLSLGYHSCRVICNSACFSYWAGGWAALYHLSRLLAANTTLRNSPGKDGSGPSVLGILSKTSQELKETRENLSLNNLNIDFRCLPGGLWQLDFKRSNITFDCFTHHQGIHTMLY